MGARDRGVDKAMASPAGSMVLTVHGKMEQSTHKDVAQPPPLGKALSTATHTCLVCSPKRTQRPLSAPQKPLKHSFVCRQEKVEITGPTVAVGAVDRG